MSLLLGNTLKDLGVKEHHTYSLFSNNSEKNSTYLFMNVCVYVCVCTERKKKKG